MCGIKMVFPGEKSGSGIKRGISRNETRWGEKNYVYKTFRYVCIRTGQVAGDSYLKYK